MHGYEIGDAMLRALHEFQHDKHTTMSEYRRERLWNDKLVASAVTEHGNDDEEVASLLFDRAHTHARGSFTLAPFHHSVTVAPRK